MIIVVGSIGFLGSEISRRLTSQDKTVRGLVGATSHLGQAVALKVFSVEMEQK